jgi:hypothetical protein
MYIHQEYQQ